MAQIKKIVKPGDLIRGAKVGVAGLDKDGNIIGTGIDTEDIAKFPEGAQSGDVLAWGGETGPEWRPHYPESGSEGDVLTLGETGPEWSAPAGGDSLYRHNITYFSAYNVFLTLNIINKSNEPIDTAYKLWNVLNDIGVNNYQKPYAASGFFNTGSQGNPSYQAIIGVFNDQGNLSIIRQDSSYGSASSALSPGSTSLNDTITEI